MKTNLQRCTHPLIDYFSSLLSCEWCPQAHTFKQEEESTHWNCQTLKKLLYSLKYGGECWTTATHHILPWPHRSYSWPRPSGPVYYVLLSNPPPSLLDASSSLPQQAEGEIFGTASEHGAYREFVKVVDVVVEMVDTRTPTFPSTMTPTIYLIHTVY